MVLIIILLINYIITTEKIHWFRADYHWSIETIRILTNRFEMVILNSTGDLPSWRIFSLRKSIPSIQPSISPFFISTKILKIIIFDKFPVMISSLKNIITKFHLSHWSTRLRANQNQFLHKRVLVLEKYFLM